MEKQTGDSLIKADFGRAIQLRRDGKLQDAIALLETAIEADGDSGELWGELALGQHQLWHQHMTKLHHQDAIKTDGFKEDPLRSSLLQETYNTFIIAMEYPVNKKNPLVLVKLVVLYIEFQAYRGALSVCTLLVEGYASSSVIQEAIFLTAVSAKALQKHRESAQYFQHVAEKSPYRLHSYQLHLLAALEFEKVGGMRDHVREAFHQAYKDMIALSPLTPSEKAAHLIYKTSKKNESQRVQLWYQDDSTWFDLGKRLMTLNFPILVCDLLAVARKRKKVIPLEILVMEGIAFQRVGDTNRAVELLTEALQREYWSDYIRCLLRRLSDGWKNQFDLEEQSASTIQCELRKHQLRVKWRDTVRSLVEARRYEMTVKIQCTWRQYKAKSLLANLRHQRHLREVAENESMALEDILLISKCLNAAAIKIQSLYKIRCARQEARFRRALLVKHNRLVTSFAAHRSAKNKQNVFHLWQHFILLQHQERREAAILIQRQARLFLSRRVYKRLLLAKQRHDRIILDCLDRRDTSVKRHVLAEWKAFIIACRELLNGAARKVQNAWRRYLSRKKYRHELRRHMIATELMHRMVADRTAQKIRDCWNALSSSAVWHRMRKYKNAVIIQRYARGMIARRLVRKVRSRRKRIDKVMARMRNKSVHQLKRMVFDGLLQNVHMQWQERDECALVIQRLYRGHRARRRVHVITECSRILDDPETSLRERPRSYVLRVCFLILARLPEQNQAERTHSATKLVRWYRHHRRKRRLLIALSKMKKQKAILNTLRANFRALAVMFLGELKKRIQVKRWRRDHAARKIQRAARNWLTFCRFRRVLNKKAQRKARAEDHAKQKRNAYVHRAFIEWRRVLRDEKYAQLTAVIRIQRAYRARIAKKSAQKIVAKKAAQAKLLESIQVKPLERCFRRWEMSLIQNCVLTVRSAARSTATISPDKWKVFAKSDGFGQSVKQQQRNLTLEQRAEIPSIVFYTLLNRVRKSGILQLSFSGGLSFTTAQMHELLAFASSVIVDGGGGDAASHLVNQVVDAMETSNACPTHKLMMYNARLDTAHAVKLCHVLKHPRGTLTALILSNVRLSTAGVVAIATALCHGHGRLEQLVLEGCGIGSIGGAALFEALCHNKQLWKLDLSGNRLSDSVCPLLSTALLTNESLQVLSLRANGLSDRGVLTYVAPTLERLCSSGLELLVVSVASVAAHHALQQAASRFVGAIRRPFRVETCDWLKS